MAAISKMNAIEQKQNLDVRAALKYITMSEIVIFKTSFYFILQGCPRLSGLPGLLGRSLWCRQLWQGARKWKSEDSKQIKTNEKEIKNEQVSNMACC